MMRLNQASMDVYAGLCSSVFTVWNRNHRRENPEKHWSVPSMSPLCAPPPPSCLIPGQGTDKEVPKKKNLPTSVQSWHSASQFKHPLTQFKNEWHLVQWLRHLASNLALLQRDFGLALWKNIKTAWAEQLCAGMQISQHLKWMNWWHMWGTFWTVPNILSISSEVFAEVRWILKRSASNTLTLVPVRIRSCWDVLRAPSFSRFKALFTALVVSHNGALQTPEYTSINSLG